MATLTPNKEEDVFAVIQSLAVEEAHLTEQKENFTTLISELETKARQELEKLKQKVDSLTLEVYELKEKCNKLRLWLKEGSTLDQNQTIQPENKFKNAKVNAAVPEGKSTIPIENVSRCRF